MEENFNEQDELITIYLPRREADILRKMIKREEGFDWLVKWLRQGAVVILGGSVLALLGAWEWIKVQL